MLGRSEVFRAAAIVTLIACFIATLAAINRRPSAPVAETFPTVTAPVTDDLTDELRRCSALGPKDAEDARCEAVWEENRRRFFGRPARPLPPQSPPGTAAPATPSEGDAR
ncbi:putative entry exclusion protein TrbK-alt [Bradyrhizobium viridifuturi]|jgi:conjugative transfer region protein TrbK|nr:putative entry exclusion protein TrbK-alt [Bradyrhizobium viridifuturi]MBR1048645.1 putative entry exclusion protein TrbK-alt [Bradyrhizobium viridifuturi]MBR1083748.1 putative entry exclusion protein TrbK-alt [Bradyrhizobium viridifuturi]MBR1099212.1 putative entry exclusion protein TrbK-alt [Bradyrhizobium viridifuturi]MBR1106368.1 putative entry exclusion protein TrbK-alt [Bradyrhizobium viridifuturi]